MLCKERLARFEREARLLASLNHPNIATLYGFEQSNGVQFLVMELADGETLAERLRRGPIPVEDALPIFKQIAEALEAAHEKGIIHRDLKPANIKVSSEGKVKVLDFGLAKAMSEDPVKSELSESPTITRDATATGVILGTAAYMSPEQARGKTVDKRTDIWAFGCCLYEALTGRMVFQGDTLSDTIAGILERDPDWKALPEPTTPGVRVVLRRCLQKDANRRLHDIADARIEMEEALTEPSMTPAEAIAHRPALRRWQAIPWIVAAFATAVAIWFVMLGSPPSTVTTRLRLSTPPLNARGSALAISPDGRRLAFLADDSGTNKLFLHSMDKLDAEPVAGTDGAWEPFFSPDGEWVGFFADDKLKKVAVAGGSPLTLTAHQWFTSATWGPDDRIYFPLYGKEGYWSVAAGGGHTGGRSDM